MKALPWIGLALLALSAHLPSFDHEFVYDDHRFVVRNPAVVEGVGIADYFSDAVTFSADQGSAGAFRPLRTLLWRGIAVVAGGTDDPFPFRLFNLFLHVIATLLVAALVAGRSSLRVGVAAAALFALHPMTVESVDWISSQADLLAAVFLFGTLWWLEKDRGGVLRLVVVGLGTLLAALAKESAVAMPIAVALCGWGRVPKAALLRETAVSALAVVLYLAWRGAVLSEAGFLQEETETLAALREMGVGWLYYLGASLMAIAPRFDHYWTHPGPMLEAVIGWVVWGAAAGWCLMGLARAWRAGVAPAASVLACALMLAFMLPVMQLLPLNIIVADRFFYLSLAPLCALIAGVVFRFTNERTALALMAAILLVGLWRCIATQGTWRNEETLWSEVLIRVDAESEGDRRPGNYERANYNWGRAVFEREMAAKAAGSPDSRHAYNAMRKGFGVVRGGAARLCRAALLAYMPVECLDAGCESLHRAVQGDQVAFGNARAVLVMMRSAWQDIVVKLAPADRRKTELAMLRVFNDPRRQLALGLSKTGPEFAALRAAYDALVLDIARSLDMPGVGDG